MKIYTLTLNPAYDVHAKSAHFTAGHENLAVITSREAGGKGVNISRALCNCGVANTAVIVLGRENSGDFIRAISDMDTVIFKKEGRIRENLTIHCAGAPETRISFRGFSLDESILRDVEDMLQTDAETVITFTGRVPEGICVSAVKAFLYRQKQRGAKIVLDSKSFELKDILDIKPWLIKPNEEEIAALLSCSVTNLAEAAEKGSIFAENGVANVLISMGDRGAVLLAEGKTYLAKPPAIKAISTIGAGDSSIAGFLTAAAQDLPPAKRLKLAVAFGTAACLTEGSQPPRKDAIDQICKEIRIIE